jgi:hypothetical protein
MSTDDYRAMAEERFRRAQEAQTDNERQGYLELARTWLAAASKVDCGPQLALFRYRLRRSSGLRKIAQTVAKPQAKR